LKKILTTLGILLTGVLQSAAADQLPLTEFGIGPGTLYQNYYPGTNDTRSFVFPAFVPILRGDTLKSDEEGARAQLFEDSRFKLDLSLDFNLAFDSEDVKLRQGMPDVDHLLQGGPELQITLDQSDSHEWMIRLPLRAAITLGDNFGGAGFTFLPDVTYLKDYSIASSNWRLGLSLGPQFSSSDYNEIYYGVDRAFETDRRAAFDPDAGYAGYRFLVTFTSINRRRFTSWFFRAESLSGSELENSSLVETDTGYTVGFIYSWLLFKSKRLVIVE